MENLKVPTLLASISVIIALVVFGANFWLFHGSLPGYKAIVYPGIVATRFFSEELNFMPKLGIMIAGQFIAYFLAALATKQVINIWSSSCR